MGYTFGYNATDKAFSLTCPAAITFSKSGYNSIGHIFVPSLFQVWAKDKTNFNNYYTIVPNISYNKVTVGNNTTIKTFPDESSKVWYYDNSNTSSDAIVAESIGTYTDLKNKLQSCLSSEYYVINSKTWAADSLSSIYYQIGKTQSYNIYCSKLNYFFSINANGKTFRQYIRKDTEHFFFSDKSLSDTNAIIATTSISETLAYSANNVTNANQKYHKNYIASNETCSFRLSYDYDIHNNSITIKSPINIVKTLAITLNLPSSITLDNIGYNTTSNTAYYYNAESITWDFNKPFAYTYAVTGSTLYYSSTNSFAKTLCISIDTVYINIKHHNNNTDNTTSIYFKYTRPNATCVTLAYIDTNYEYKLVPVLTTNPYQIKIPGEATNAKTYIIKGNYIYN